MPKPMRISYDTEFYEDGKTIDLISIGMVREDGKEYYAVSNEFNTARVINHPWLMENVMTSIDHVLVYSPLDGIPYDFVVTDAAAKSREQIKKDILEFTADVWPELWSWYGAYDHVALCQLFGRMIDLPSRLPMFTHDIKQEQKRLKLPNDSLPRQVGGNHNALEDARHHMRMFEYIKALGDGSWTQ